VNVKNLGEIEAIAFDIDGTIYPQWKIHLIAFFHYVCHSIFFLHYGLVRHELHGLEQTPDFNKVQTEKMAEHLHCSYEKAEEKLNKIVYHGLEKYFKRISCYKNCVETVKKFKEAGFKIALLSDFPPEQKGEIWGIKKYCDVMLGTEALGALKPDPFSFIKMAEELKVAPEKILFVGNSRKYDVAGSKAAGMKSAYLLAWRYRIFRFLNVKEADITFTNYRQLQDFVLN
jgi:putative hydrolase of the HAD superfamily